MANNNNDSGSSCYRKNPIPGKSVNFPKLEPSKDPSPPDSDNDVPELADSAIFAIVKEKEASGRSSMGPSAPEPTSPSQSAAAAVLAAANLTSQSTKRAMSTSSDKCSPPHKRVKLMDESMSPIMSKEAENAFAKAISLNWLTNNMFPVITLEDKNAKKKKNPRNEDEVPPEEILFVEKADGKKND